MSYSLPIQGTTVTFLTKDKTGPVSSKWIRNVADVYGDPDQLKLTGTGTLPHYPKNIVVVTKLMVLEGPGHHVVTGDFDGEFDWLSRL